MSITSNALYRDGLGRPPELEALAFWQAKGETGATRAEVLAAIASSEEALKNVDSSSPKEETAYGRWVAKHDTISEADRRMIRAHISILPFCPLISVTIAVGRTSAKVGLYKSFASVIYNSIPTGNFASLSITLLSR